MRFFGLSWASAGGLGSFVRVYEIGVALAMAGILAEAPASNHRDQFVLFAMMSYAEKLSPGGIYRSSRQRGSPR